MENVTDNKYAEWQTRLVDERAQLLDRTLKLKKFMDDPETRMSKCEWEMLNQQFYGMKEYLRALTNRCNYYKLIETTDLTIY